MTISPFGSPRVRLACAVALAAALAGPGSARPSAQAAAKAAARAEARRRLHRQDQGGHRRPADPDRAGRSPAGVRQGADAAEVPRLHPRRAGQADVPQGHRPLHGGARQGVRPRDDDEDRRERRRARHGRGGGRRRGDDQEPRQVSPDHRAAHRSAQADRRAGEAAHRDRQADLLRDGQHPLARDRQPRDADGAGLPAGGRRVAVHPDDPQQRRSSCSRRRAKSTAARSRSTTSAPRQRGSRRRRWSTGASTCSTTTTATASASACG